MRNKKMMEAIDFTYVLLETYKGLPLTEKEAMVVLQIDHLLDQGNSLITADILSLRMGMKIKEIDTVLADLLKRGLVTYAKGEKGTLKTSLEPLRERIYSDFATRMEMEDDLGKRADSAEALKRLNAECEKSFRRTLSPIEQSTLSQFLMSGYEEEAIRDAIIDVGKTQKRTMGEVDKLLRAKRRRDDIAAEGVSAVSDTYDKSIEETIELGKKIFL